MKRSIALVLTVMLMSVCFTSCGDPKNAGNVSTARNGIVNGANDTIVERAEEGEEMVPYEIIPQITDENGNGMIGDE